MTLGTRLRKYREKKRLSQKEVAEHIGVSQTTYCNWENDCVSYQVKYLSQLSQLFEVSMLELILEGDNNHAKASNGHFQHKHQTVSDKTVDNRLVYADLLKSKEEVIQLLKDENSRLKALIEIRK